MGGRYNNIYEYLKSNFKARVKNPGDFVCDMYFVEIGGISKIVKNDSYTIIFEFSSHRLEEILKIVKSFCKYLDPESTPVLSSRYVTGFRINLYS